MAVNISISPRDQSTGVGGAEHSVSIRSTTGTTYFYGRFILTYGYSGSGNNTYYVKNIIFQMKKSNSLNEGITFTYDRHTLTFTGFSSYSNSMTKKFGNTILASKISTS